MEDADRTRRLATAGLHVLLTNPMVDRTKIAAVGYCFGGTLVLELARTGADVKAVIGFHPGLTTTRPQDSANIVGKVLVCVGPTTRSSRATSDWRSRTRCGRPASTGG